MIYANILQLIGKTPIIRLQSVGKTLDSIIYAKVESYNPGGSLKDRPALYMIEQAEQEGILGPGYTIIESSSGNMGVSLALIGGVKGYRVICVVDPKTPEHSVLAMKAFGAEIVMVDTPDASGSYQKNRIARVRDIAKTIRNSFVPNQYSNPNNPLSHSKTTAREIINDLHGNIDFLVSSVSTGGHITGIATTLKRELPHVKIIGVEPEGSVVFGGEAKPYLQTGTGLSFVPDNINLSLVDDHFKVSDNDAFSMTKRLMREEGLMVGISSGAVVHVALKVAGMNSKKSIVCILPDDGEKYLKNLLEMVQPYENRQGYMKDIV
ncbi:MAG: cysteine synthase family protein [Bacillota bacterium]|nr:cysteine synthase family protein [Bacillota bacterium]